MPFINLKFAAIGIMLVSFIAFAMHYDYIKEQNKTLKIEKIALEANATEKERVANLTDTARIEANQKLEAAKDEIKKRDDCIASGKCKRVVYVKSACIMPQAEASGGATEGYAELAPGAQRAASDFELKLAEKEKQLDICLDYSRGVSTLQDDRK